MQLATTITTQLHNHKLVFACAWCKPVKHANREQLYTHGMCAIHKESFINSIRSRVTHIRLPVKRPSVRFSG